MSKKNILIITGTRADFGLLEPTILELRKSNKLEPKLLVTGMHTLKKFGSTVGYIRSKGYKIDFVVSIGPKDDMIQSLNKEINGIHKYCKQNKIDFMLLLGDRDEMLAGAIVAGHIGIPIAHIHGGDLTGYVVDEAIRHAITKFSNLHFTASKSSYGRVISLCEEKWRVFNVGAVGLDLVKNTNFKTKKELSDEFKLDNQKKWFIVLHHPTPLDPESPKDQICPLMKSVEEEDCEKIVIYPNSDTGSNQFIKEINKYKNKKTFYIFKNLPRESYLSFLKVSDLLIGNSSSGIIESTYFKIPVINIGNRQKNREHAENVINSGYNLKSIKLAIKKASSNLFKDKCNRSKSPYGCGNASKNIVKQIEKNIDRKNLLFKEFIN